MVGELTDGNCSVLLKRVSAGQRSMGFRGNVLLHFLPASEFVGLLRKPVVVYMLRYLWCCGLRFFDLET